MTRRASAVAVAVALLGALLLLAPTWHLAAAALAWLLVRSLAPDLATALGQPSRWLGLGVVLALLGAWLGPADFRTAGVPWSATGASAGATMVARALALVMLTSALTAAVPLRRWIAASRLPVLRRVTEVVVVAANLVPVLLRAIDDARRSLQERRPGLRSLPRRFELLAVHAVVRAVRLADEVAFDMTVAAHNRSGSSKSPEESS